MTTTFNHAVKIARDYYNSEDADAFYHRIWGGEDIHVGIYVDPAESIREASRRTVERMAAKLSTEPNEGHACSGHRRWLRRGCPVPVQHLRMQGDGSESQRS